MARLYKKCVRGLKYAAVVTLLFFHYLGEFVAMITADGANSLGYRIEHPLTLRSPVDNLPWVILGLRPGVSKKKVRARQRELAMILHPDRGGTSHAMARVNDAAAELTNQRIRFL